MNHKLRTQTRGWLNQLQITLLLGVVFLALAGYAIHRAWQVRVAEAPVPVLESPGDPPAPPSAGQAGVYISTRSG